MASWLHAVHATAASGATGAGSSPGPPSSPASPPQQPEAREGWQRLTLGVLRCFAAWTKWGCLQHVDQAHAAYFATLAGQLLFAPDPSASPLFQAAVDAATEIVEHATEALQPLLLQLAAALPARAAALRCAGGGNGGGSEEAAEELCHVFALFCSTHCTLCMVEGPEGQALRQVGKAWRWRWQCGEQAALLFLQH